MEIFSENLPADSPRHPARACGWQVGLHLRPVLPIAAGDFAETVAVAVLSPADWRGNSDSPTTGTTDEHPGGIVNYNSVLSDAQAETAARSLSTDSVECAARHLEPHGDENTLEEGPREVLLPSVKSRSEVAASLRGDFTRPNLPR